MNLGFIGGGTGGLEMLVVFVAILLLFGAKRLPEIARSLGKALAELRRASQEVRNEILQADQDLRGEPETRAGSPESPSVRTPADAQPRAPVQAPPPPSDADPHVP